MFADFYQNHRRDEPETPPHDADTTEPEADEPDDRHEDDRGGITIFI